MSIYKLDPMNFIEIFTKMANFWLTPLIQPDIPIDNNNKL
jgi:hypothetical protein